MAYITILDTQLDPDAPITSGLGYQLRNNPLASIQGDDDSAPKLNGINVAPIYGYNNSMSGLAGDDTNAIEPVDTGYDRQYVVYINRDITGGGALSSTMRLEGSDNGLSYTNLLTVATNTSGGGSAVGPLVWASSDNSNATYRYFRVRTNGDAVATYSGSIVMTIYSDEGY